MTGVIIGLVWVPVMVAEQADTITLVEMAGNYMVHHFG
jgi:hypothetical protein